MNYVGITGFTNNNQVQSILSRSDCKKIMFGVLSSAKTLRGETNKYPFKYPKNEQIPCIFSSDSRAYNLIHFSSDAKDQLPLQVDSLVRLFGTPQNARLNGLQLNIVWPELTHLRYIKDRYGLDIVFQISGNAFGKGNYDAIALKEMITPYTQYIDHVLIDMSGGNGKEMSSSLSLRIIDELLKLEAFQSGKVNIGVAGGLSHETLDVIRPIVAKYPSLSIDAEGKLVGYGDRTESEFIDLSLKYLSCAQGILEKSA